MYIEVFAEAYEHNPLAMLGNEVFAVDDFIVLIAAAISVRNPIAEFVKCLHNYTEGIALVMALQIFYVFKYKCDWSLCCNYPRYIEEEGALRVTFEAMFAA